MDILINGRPVGPKHPVFVIAEACINHEGDIRVAREMVFHARAAGVDAIKFQLHVLDDEMLARRPSRRTLTSHSMMRWNAPT